MRTKVGLFVLMAVAGALGEAQLARADAGLASRSFPASPFPEKGSILTASRVRLESGGLQRNYLIQPIEGAGPFPVVIFLHGGTQSAEQVWRQTSLPTLAARERFLFVAPNGVGGHWNDGRGTVLGGKASNADDVGFLREVVADVVRNHRGDPHRIFLAGVSNGGFMTMRFACQAGGLLRAAANAISDLPADEQSTCKAPPIPWLSINGTADPIVPFDGMAGGTMKNREPQPPLISADATFQFWAARDGCSLSPASERLAHRDVADPTWVEKRTVPCKDGRRSEQVVVHGGGHNLPNQQYGALIRAVVGRSNQDVDGGQMIWEFFKSTM